MNPIILLHGALGSGTQLERLNLELAKLTETYVFTFSAHGGKAGEFENFSIERFADELLGFLDREDVEKADVFGFSMGGYVALKAAMESSRIGKIATLGTKFYWNEESAKKEVGMLNIENLEEKVPKYALELANRHGVENWKKVVSSTAEMMIELGKKPALCDSELAQINNPVMLLVGEKDKMVSVQETNKVKNLIPNHYRPLKCKPIKTTS